MTAHPGSRNHSNDERTSLQPGSEIALSCARGLALKIVGGHRALVESLTG